MEDSKKTMEQLPSRYLDQSTSIFQSKDIQDNNAISIYSGALTQPVVVASVVQIKSAFPSLPAGFYDVFISRVKENGFCDERLVDAVNYVIDNCIYPTPTIANFISFDRTIKFRTHEEMCKEAMTYQQVWKEWLPVKMPNMPKTVWIFANDIEKYNLKTFIVKK